MTLLESVAARISAGPHGGGESRRRRGSARSGPGRTGALPPEGDSGRSASGGAPQRAARGVRGGHIPVLATELLDVLDLRPGQTAIDCTFGDGGHARLVAERLGASGTLVAIDRDPAAEASFAALAADTACSMRFLRCGYAEALTQLSVEGLRADVAYFDLGMSSMQVDTRERGFSYSYDAPLDMRMDPAQELCAREIVADWDERRLAHALREYGEERHAATIARAIVAARAQRPITTTHELVQLDRALPLAWSLLATGGALAAISFHSLEDRRVKRFLADRARGCICPPDLPVCVCGREPEAQLLTRRSLVPSAAEVAANPRASSARLRAARKLADEPASASEGQAP